MIRTTLLTLLIGALALAPVATAQEESGTEMVRARTGVVLSKSANRLTLWTKNGREVFQMNDSTIMPQRKLQDGNLIVLRETAQDSKVAAQIVIVDEQVWVTGKASRGERALVGTTWPSQSPSHLIVRTDAGEEMFVIDPKTFRRPLPEPNQRVAVTYRVETTNPPRYKATGYVILGEAIARSPVEIIYSDVPIVPEQVAEAPAPAPTPVPAPEPEVMTELPQTASNLPSILALGLLLIAVGSGLRRVRAAR